MPFAVYVLGLTIFCMGTTEVMLAGILPEVASDLGVSLSTAGMLISGFALGIVVGGPVLTIRLSRVVRKHALLALLAVFVLGQTLGALAPGYGVLMASRVVSAVVFGAFFGIAASVAISLAGTSARARAMAVMVAGLTLANVLGLPAVTFLAQHLSWRAAFAAVAATSALCLVAVATLIPREERPRGVRLREELAVYTRPHLWTALATSGTYVGGQLAVFAYLTPMLTRVTGFPSAVVPGLLLLYGLGSLIGTYLSGRFADRHPMAMAVAGVAGLCGALALVGALAGSKPGMIVATLLLGIAGFAANPTLGARVMRAADDGALAAASNGSAINIGIAAGPWASGAALGAGLGFGWPVGIGLAFAATSLAILLISEAVQRRPAGRPGDSAPAPPREGARSA